LTFRIPHFAFELGGPPKIFEEIGVAFFGFGSDNIYARRTARYPNTGFEIIVPGLGLLLGADPLADRPISLSARRAFSFVRKPGFTPRAEYAWRTKFCTLRSSFCI
jgi:hypothetical protein